MCSLGRCLGPEEKTRELDMGEIREHEITAWRYSPSRLHRGWLEGRTEAQTVLQIWKSLGRRELGGEDTGLGLGLESRVKSSGANSRVQP